MRKSKLKNVKPLGPSHAAGGGRVERTEASAFPSSKSEWGVACSTRFTGALVHVWILGAGRQVQPGPRGQRPVGPVALQRQLRAAGGQDPSSLVLAWSASGREPRTPALILGGAVLPGLDSKTHRHGVSRLPGHRASKLCWGEWYLVDPPCRALFFPL